jgi:Rab-GTPase-TBC domain
VLVTYSWRNETIGYCQGMSFITARLLTLGFNEEVTSMQEAFWILSQIIEKYMPFSYYTDMSGLILDMKVLEKTILKYLPKLSKKFLSIGLEPMLFSVQWFICIFSYNFSGPVVARLWDIFFIEGIGFIFKVALSILYLFRHKIMDIKGFEDGVIFCAHLAEQITDIDLILETTMRFDINIQEIDDLRNSLSNTNTQGVNYQQYCSNDRECKDLKRLTSDYLTFLCNTQVSIKDQYFDDESVPKYCDVGNINRYEDNFMLAVENHYCSKETPKQSFNKLLLQASNNHFSRKIAMPRISLSPYFLQSDIVEVAESLINN